MGKRYHTLHITLDYMLGDLIRVVNNVRKLFLKLNFTILVFQ